MGNVVEEYKPQVRSAVLSDTEIRYGVMASHTTQISIDGPARIFECVLALNGLAYLVDVWEQDGRVSMMDLFPLSPCCAFPLNGVYDDEGPDRDECSECGKEALRGFRTSAATIEEGELDDHCRSYLEEWLHQNGRSPLVGSVEASLIVESAALLSVALTLSVPSGYADQVITPFALALLESLP